MRRDASHSAITGFTPALNLAKEKKSWQNCSQPVGRAAEFRCSPGNIPEPLQTGFTLRRTKSLKLLSEHLNKQRRQTFEQVKTLVYDRYQSLKQLWKEVKPAGDIRNCTDANSGGTARFTFFAGGE